MKITVNRDSVCLGDDCFDHAKEYELPEHATYQHLFRVLKADRYLPHIAGNNVVWVLSNERQPCIFSYFTRTDKLFPGPVENRLDKLCEAPYHVHFRYFTTPLKWKEEICRMYGGDTYSMWRDGWLDEVQHCDYVMSLGTE